MIHRKKTNQVAIGDRFIGGDAPILVQSMTTTLTTDIDATVQQIWELTPAGCEIVRVAVPDMAAAKCLGEIRRQINIPLVADIHFQYQLALEAIAQGVDKLRLNPGNIRDPKKVDMVCKAAKERGIPIRVGVNAGSINIKKYPEATPEALVDSAQEHVRVLEENDFHDIIISLKSTDVPTMIRAYQLASEEFDYPLHLGVTEAGLPWQGNIRSAVGIGALLAQGIGDTIRVSLTGDSCEEAKAGHEILRSLNLRQSGITLISCPSCGRADVDIVAMAAEVDRRLRERPDLMKLPMRVAVMGCEVNGPGEARHADVGLAGGVGVGLLIEDGEVVRKYKEAEMVDALMARIEEKAKAMEAGIGGGTEDSGLLQIRNPKA